jgi:DNA-binding NtrC family response regulator
MAGELVFAVDDDSILLSFMKALLERKGVVVKTFSSGELCLNHLDEDPAIIFLDKMMPGLDGVETLKRIKERNDEIPVIMVTSMNDAESAVEVLQLGAYDYIVKPFEEARVYSSLEKALDQVALKQKVRHLEGELKGVFGATGIIGNSEPMKRLMEKVEKVMDSRASVLIQGETGTGKELLARAIHYGSSYGKGLFVDINCGAIPETLQESELFGYKKGAFTGAVDSRVGKLELAHGGTLFLDEVAEMSPATQTKFLRFLQEKNFERIGENRKINVDARVICATNKDLLQEVENKTFREDLYYRLAVFPITIPPLRERKEDIVPLCDHFLRKYGPELKKDINSFSGSAIDCLRSYSWPGNIRQLENVIYHAMIITESNSIEKQSLPMELKEQLMQKGEMDSSVPPTKVTPTEVSSATGIQPWKEVEKRTIAEALKIAGSIPKAAKALGISRSTFYRMVEKFGLK